MDMVCILFCKSQMAEVIVFSTNTWGAEPQGFIQSPGQPRICRGTKVKTNDERAKLF